MSCWTRRRWMQATMGSGALAALGLGRTAAGGPPPQRQGMTLSIGTYSLRNMTLEESIDLVASIGYDGIEIAVQPGQAGQPDQVSPDRRKEVRKRLETSGLRLSAIMEHLVPHAESEKHTADVARLRGAMQLGRQVSPGACPLVQTVLGRGQWEAEKGMYRDRLGDWAEAARAEQVVLAIKPHRGDALSRPCEAVWLIEQLGRTPWLRMVYDYSHFLFRDMSMDDTIRESLPYLAHVAVKDAAQRDDRVVFLLPGEGGTVDYPRLLQLLYRGGYRGDVCCEVSAMVSSKPGYDAAAAAKTCYRNLAAAFAAANVPRK